MPDQCPECARFLKKDLVSSLARDPAPCPQCGATLTAAMFTEAAVTDETSSVRPPDLGTVIPDGPPHPLDGWDEGPERADVVDLSRWRRDRRGLDPEAVATVAVGAGAVGAVAGALVSRRRGRGAVVGGLLAAVVGVIAAETTRR